MFVTLSKNYLFEIDELEGRERVTDYVYASENYYFNAFSHTRTTLYFLLLHLFYFYFSSLYYSMLIINIIIVDIAAAFKHEQVQRLFILSREKKRFLK